VGVPLEDPAGRALPTDMRVRGHVHERRATSLPQVPVDELRARPRRHVDDLRLMTTKRCTKCHAVKGLQGFHRSSTSNDGRASRCKACRNEDSRAYVERRRRAEATAEAAGHLLDAKGVL
jgi:hypothetical protein